MSAGSVHRGCRIKAIAAPKPGIRFAKVRHPIVPCPAKRIGILGLKVFIGVQRRGAEQHRDVQSLLVHRRQLREVVVVARQGVVDRSAIRFSRKFTTWLGGRIG